MGNNKVICKFKSIENQLQELKGVSSVEIHNLSSNGETFNDINDVFSKVSLEGGATIKFIRNTPATYNVYKQDLDWTEEPSNWDELNVVTYAIFANGDFAYDEEATLDNIGISGSLSAPQEQQMVKDNIAALQNVGDQTEFYTRVLSNNQYVYWKWIVTKQTDEKQYYELWQLLATEWSTNPEHWYRIAPANSGGSQEKKNS